MKENRIGGAWGTNGRQETCTQGFGGRTEKELSVKRKIIFKKWILKKRDGQVWPAKIWLRLWIGIGST
jgi:hypothetical protein